MATNYDVQTYLLDRANIHDTVFNLMLSFDEVDTPKLIKSVYTAKVHLDYTAIMGGEPQHITSEEWAKSLEPIHKAHDSSQHAVQDLLINLPQPSAKEGSSKPDVCTAICIGSATFYKRNAEGVPCLMERRTLGRYDLELTRVKELEDSGENPWRISKQKVTLNGLELGTVPQVN